MKIWHQHGSDHSANLVMIGHFKDTADATMANEIIAALTKQVMEDRDTGELVLGGPSEKYSKSMLDLLGELNVMSVGPRELEQFLYDIRLNVKDSKIIIETDEYDISAYFKVMIDCGARIDIYSAHDYPGTEHGRKS